MSNINLFEKNILFQDNHLIIINKKPGELTQGDKTNDKTLGEKVKYYLKEKYNLHIITNGFSQVQFTKLKKSKLAPFFATVTSSEEVGVKKPNPLVFTTALLKAGATAQSSVMIGDTFDADILGAEGVGMDTIFFNYRKEIPKNGYKVVDYLLEIKDLL